MNESNLDKSNLSIPTHIGFIMDGNRRWAKSRNLPTLEGHRRGFNKVKQLVDNCLELGITHVTIWAFSTENWDREEKELKYLMDLFREMFKKYHTDMKKKGVKMLTAGRLSDFPEDIQEEARIAMEETKDNTKMVLNIAFSYGGRPEIVDMIKRVISDGVKTNEVTDEMLSEKYIYEAGQPNIDVVVRTSGEQRHSGFMLWQSAYAEYIFLNECWPDFDKKSLQGVIEEYTRRERRFGK